MNNKTRAFIAIELTPQMKDELTELQRKFRTADADVKWVKPESMHLTLKFLGNISSENIENIKDVLNKITSSYKPFEISLSNIGCFPNFTRPRVIWVGIKKGCTETKIISEKIETELCTLGFRKEDRPFTAHLTLGRVRSLKRIQGLIDIVKNLDFKPTSSFVVDKITLFQSTLTPKGPIYTPLYSCQLRKQS